MSKMVTNIKEYWAKDMNSNIKIRRNHQKIFTIASNGIKAKNSNSRAVGIIQ